MASSVWVFVCIPQRDYEKDIREKELTRALSEKKNNIKNSLKTKDKSLDTIDESSIRISNGISNKAFEDLELPKLEFEKVLEEALLYLGIIDATWVLSKNGKFHQVYFPCELSESDQIIQYLTSLGIGSKLGTSIGIIPFTLYYRDEDFDEFKNPEVDNDDDDSNEKIDLKRELSGFKVAQNKFLKSVTARLTVAQVVDDVRAGADLTFDFVCYLIFASWIAAMGLLENSVVSLVASMLVSPMMGPVMALTFGTIIKDKSLIRMGFRNLGVCFAICLLFGYFMGLICFNFTKQWADQNWPTNEMYARGLPRVTWVGTLVALPSGAAVAISLLSGNQASLVGVAISVSLLPPAVNSGLLWAFATIKSLYSFGEDYVKTVYQSTNKSYFLPPSLTPQETYTPFYNDNLAIESAILGVLSLCLSLVNITCIFIMAFVLLKIKEVAPLSSMSSSTRRFFQEDIRIARNYNAGSDGKANELGRDLLEEWATIAGLNPEEFLSNKPEARVTQIQTLADIAKDVEADEVYRSIMKNSLTPNQDIVRRISQTIYQSNARGQMRKMSDRSANIPSSFVISGIENGAISRRRKHTSISSNGSRVSQLLSSVLPGIQRYSADESREGFVSRDTLQIPDPSPVFRSQSAVVVNSAVFTFENENLQLNELRSNDNERQRRRSNVLLRRSLQTSEHSPFSVWPSARSSASSVTRFTVTRVNENTQNQINK